MIAKTISVALCTYNAGTYLYEQLNSIAAQIRLPDEVVICDDQSNDDTLEIVKRFASKVTFPVRLYVNSLNLGSTKNFEQAIKHCTGDIIALSDQDDIWHPEKLMRIESILSNSPQIGAVFTDAEVVDENLSTLGYRLWESVLFNKSEQKLVSNGKSVEVLLKHNVVTGATMAFRSQYKEVILPIPKVWVHDGWIAILIAAVADLGIINEPLIKYRQHSRQQIGARKRKFREQIAESISTKSTAYQVAINQYKPVYERLLQFDTSIFVEQVTLKLQKKMTHLNFRSTLPKRKLFRLPKVILELISLRYHWYSNGFRSAAKDIFLN